MITKKKRLHNKCKDLKDTKTKYILYKTHYWRRKHPEGAPLLCASAIFNTTICKGRCRWRNKNLQKSLQSQK